MTILVIPETDQDMENAGPKPGVWWLVCKSDPRWDCAGSVDDLESMRDLHPEARERLEEIQAHVGGEPPEDLIYTAARD